MAVAVEFIIQFWRKSSKDFILFLSHTFLRTLLTKTRQLVIKWHTYVASFKPHSGIPVKICTQRSELVFTDYALVSTMQNKIPMATVNVVLCFCFTVF